MATRLGVADGLGDEVKSTAQLAIELSLHEESLYRLMRMLASLGVFTETAHRVFKNSKSSDYLRQDNPRNVRALILLHNDPVMTSPWFTGLEECLRSGTTPFVVSHDAELFEYMDQHPDFDHLFAQAMDSVAALSGDAYLRDFDWGRFDRIIDVGGSTGSKSLAILRLHPQLRAVVFDRPNVITTARAYWQDKVDADLLFRLEFVGGDMCQSIPAASSIYNLFVFMAVFHGMADATCIQILQNLKIAMADQSATAVIIDSIAAEMNIDPTIAAFDMQMLIGTKGRERTLPEWRDLFARTGFRVVEVVPVRTFARFIVVRPS